MKLGAYLRVSTSGQVEDGYGIPIQREQVQRWASKHRHRIVAWHVDEGLSGSKSPEDRRGLAAALQSVCEQETEGVVVAKLDRFARSLTVQEAALAHVWRCGGRVFSTDTGEVLKDDPDDPMRTAMRQMVGVFSELERAMIAKRLRDGRQFKHKQGGFAYGSPGFGWRAHERQLTPDVREQEALRRIKELRAEGLSIRRIIEVLESEGVSPKRGRHWNPGTLSRILKSVERSMD